MGSWPVDVLRSLAWMSTGYFALLADGRAHFDAAALYFEHGLARPAFFVAHHRCDGDLARRPPHLLGHGARALFG